MMEPDQNRNDNPRYGQPRQEEIAARAYEIWDQAGRPEGMDIEHWTQAERELSEGAGTRLEADASRVSVGFENRRTGAPAAEQAAVRGTDAGDALAPARAPAARRAGSTATPRRRRGA